MLNKSVKRTNEIFLSHHIHYLAWAVHIIITKIFQCYVCGDQLWDRYLTYKDQPVCEKDFKVKYIFSILKIIKILNSQAIGHVCSVCDQIITGEVYVVDEAYFCEKDFEVS